MQTPSELPTSASPQITGKICMFCHVGCLPMHRKARKLTIIDSNTQQPTCIIDSNTQQPTCTRPLPSLMPWQHSRSLSMHKTLQSSHAQACNTLHPSVQRQNPPVHKDLAELDALATFTQPLYAQHSAKFSRTNLQHPASLCTVCRD